MSEAAAFAFVGFVFLTAANFLGLWAIRATYEAIRDRRQLDALEALTPSQLRREQLGEQVLIRGYADGQPLEGRYGRGALVRKITVVGRERQRDGSSRVIGQGTRLLYRPFELADERVRVTVDPGNHTQLLASGVTRNAEGGRLGRAAHSKVVDTVTDESLAVGETVLALGTLGEGANGPRLHGRMLLSSADVAGLRTALLVRALFAGVAAGGFVFVWLLGLMGGLPSVWALLSLATAGGVGELAWRRFIGRVTPQA